MTDCTAASPCHADGCVFCDPASWLTSNGEAEAEWATEPEAPAEESLFVDMDALFAKGFPPPPAPVLLTRDDGNKLFYAKKVNVLFGDPECGKTWIALAAVAEALNAGRRAAVVDLDHNGAQETAQRLLKLGATEAALRNPNLFKFAEPEDKTELILTVHGLKMWRPAAVIMDSLGELLPMLGLNSNVPDDYTVAHREALTPLANAGAAVVVIDHLPKGDEARTRGQTGTMAKKRAINGVSLRVTVREQFAPGRGGSADLTIEKDRPGGVRAHCPSGGKNQMAGRFVMSPRSDGSLSWRITEPKVTDTGVSIRDSDLAEIDAMFPKDRTVRKVKERLGCGTTRAMSLLQTYRDLHESENDDED